MTRKIEISYKTVVFTVLFLLSLWFVYYIKDILFLFFLSLLLMAVLNPSVNWLTRRRIPRVLSVIIVYLALLSGLGLAVGGVIPPLVEQSANFAVSLPVYLENLGLTRYLRDEVVRELVSQLGSIPGQLLKVSLTVFSNILSILMIMVISFYLLLARGRTDSLIEDLFGSERKEKVEAIFNEIEIRLGSWARGELFLMTIVGLMTFVGLFLLKVPYAVPLALLSGILELVPNIGPTLSAVPAMIIGFGINPYLGLAVLGLYFLVQQIENYIIVPKVMEKSVGVNPVVTILALSVGFRLAGVVGAIVSIPVFLVIKTVVSNLYKK